MSRLSAFVRRVFGAVKPILVDISTSVVSPALFEIQQQRAKTDEARRAIVKRLVEQYIAKKWPHYAFLAPKAVDLVFSVVRDRLKKR